MSQNQRTTTTVAYASHSAGTKMSMLQAVNDGISSIRLGPGTDPSFHLFIVNDNVHRWDCFPRSPKHDYLLQINCMSPINQCKRITAPRYCTMVCSSKGDLPSACTAKHASMERLVTESNGRQRLPLCIQNVNASSQHPRVPWATNTLPTPVNNRTSHCSESLLSRQQPTNMSLLPRTAKRKSTPSSATSPAAEHFISTLCMKYEQYQATTGHWPPPQRAIRYFLPLMPKEELKR
jgi:hypothetical protein